MLVDSEKVYKIIDSYIDEIKIVIEKENRHGDRMALYWMEEMRDVLKLKIEFGKR